MKPSAQLHRLLPAVTLLLASTPGFASGFLLFQHGGRGAGQAGAFAARASDPSAVTYNPAALVHLEGLQAQAGIDFTTPTDTYESGAGRFSSNHEINFPPSGYLTWKPGGDSRWAFGLGLDEPMFDNVHWGPKQFPGRFLTRRQETQISELHLAGAFDLGDGWSVGLGARYAYGRIKAGSNAVRALPGQNAAQEVEIDYSTTASGTGFDGAVQYRTDVWGFGATVRSAVTVSGNSDPTITPRTDVLPATGGGLAIDTRGRELAMETPLQATIGGWIAPYPELRIELDAAYAAWSSTGNRFAYYPGGIASDHLTFRDRDWRNTTSLRLGVEGDVTDAIAIYGGLAFEPSPVRASSIEPGFDRGDTFVYALGASYSFPQISFDLGWSMHQMQSRNADGQELQAPSASGHYSSRDQAFSLSVRWRFGA